MYLMYLLLRYAPLKPGESLTDEAYSKYSVLAVDRPFRAPLRAGLEVLYSCSRRYWRRCTGRAVIFGEVSV